MGMRSARTGAVALLVLLAAGCSAGHSSSGPASSGVGIVGSVVVGSGYLGPDILGVAGIVGSDLVGFTVRDARRCRGDELLA